MNKFERLIEYILNEQDQKARELFHEIVVERSRNIYEDLMAQEEIGGSPVDSMVDEIETDEQGMDSELDDMDSELDDMDSDLDDMSDDQESDGAIEDRVMDLEDALDELKSEFDRLMSAEESEEAEDMEAEEAEDMEAEEADDMEDKVVDETSHDSEESDAELAELREYIEKVAQPKGEDHKAKSPVAGKNDMGGTAKNIVQGGDKTDASKPKVGDMGAVDPRKAAKTAFGKKAPAASDSDVKSTSPVGSK